MEEVIKALQEEFNARPTHFISFDVRFCGQKGTRRVTTFDNKVNCKHCLLRQAELEIYDEGLEHFDPTFDTV